MTEKSFDAKIAHIHPMLGWIKEQLSSDKVPGGVLKKLELAAEEALVNIIYHAYKNEGGQIFIDLNVEPGKVELMLIDQGPAFNPLKHIHKKEDVPLMKRKEGGLGILFIRKCTDEVHYKRVGKENRLKMVVQF